MYALGRLFDIGTAFVPTELVGANGVTGAYVSLKHAGGVTFVFVGNGASTDIVDFDFQQATDSSGSGGTDLDVITEWYKKSETTLDNDETWTRVTQTAASEITNAGSASEQLLAVVEIEASQLSDGFCYVSVNVPDPGANATMYGAGLWILRDLKAPRKPANMPAPLS